VGADARGAAAVAELRAAGVEPFLAVDGERPTGTCIVLVSPGGERTMFPDAGANDGLRPEDLPAALLRAGDHLHVAGYALLRDGSRPAARSAIERALAAGMTVSVDPSSAALASPAFLELAEGARLLLPNAAEAVALAGERDPVAAARALAGRFGEVVVKLGAAGALWTDGADNVRAPALRVSAIDTTGAGDAFAAGLLAARVGGAAPAEALAAACKLAATAVVTEGARPPAGP
jgi:sugar/nucleoside kinase (ribokinase family)